MPYAGGGPADFQLWQQRARRVNVLAAHLPGRESRLSEPPTSDLWTVVAGLAGALDAIPGELALFGHSLGGLIAYEVTRRLESTGDDRIRALFISGCPAPPFEPDHAHELPTPDLLRHLARFGGVSAAALEHPELLELVLPTVRADLAMLHNYREGDGFPVSCPTYVLHGSGDVHCGPSDVAGWTARSSEPVRVIECPGGHFFPFEGTGTAVLDIVERELAAGLREAR